jgi:hypothetical protein
MAGLTVTEKEHWKERIERRLDNRIEAIWAREPNLKERIDDEARQKALESLHLAELSREADEIDQQKEQIDKRLSQIAKQMLAVVRGVPVDAVDEYHYRAEQEIEAAVIRRQRVFEDELLAAHEIGSQIVKLRQEKENLLDTIWLATSPSQLKTLWTKVAELIQDEMTPLQQEAIAIPPVETE